MNIKDFVTYLIIMLLLGIMLINCEKERAPEGYLFGGYALLLPDSNVVKVKEGVSWSEDSTIYIVTDTITLKDTIVNGKLLIKID